MVLTHGRLSVDSLVCKTPPCLPQWMDVGESQSWRQIETVYTNYQTHKGWTGQSSNHGNRSCKKPFFASPLDCQTGAAPLQAAAWCPKYSPPEGQPPRYFLQYCKSITIRRSKPTKELLRALLMFLFPTKFIRYIMIHHVPCSVNIICPPWTSWGLPRPCYSPLLPHWPVEVSIEESSHAAFWISS